MLLFTELLLFYLYGIFHMQFYLPLKAMQMQGKSSAIAP